MRTPAGDVRLDETGRLAGRGAYLCREDGCWRTAAAKGAIERALGVALPAELVAALEAGPADGTMTKLMTTMTTRTDEGGTGGQE